MCDISCSNTVNSIGLVFDILGALLIWRFGLPEMIRRDGAVFLEIQGPDQNEIEQARTYDSMSTVGITFLVVGFCLQLFSNFL